MSARTSGCHSSCRFNIFLLGSSGSFELEWYSIARCSSSPSRSVRVSCSPLRRTNSLHALCVNFLSRFHHSGNSQWVSSCYCSSQMPFGALFWGRSGVMSLTLQHPRGMTVSWGAECEILHGECGSCFWWRVECVLLLWEYFPRLRGDRESSEVEITVGPQSIFQTSVEGPSVV